MKYLTLISSIFAVSAIALFTSASIIFVRLSEKLPVLLAVLLAAVFVRLARGMPTIPYEKVAESKARAATLAFRALISAYVSTFFVFIVAITLNLIVSLLKPQEIAQVPHNIIPLMLAVVDILVVASIAFLVRSDVALAKTQADMMDEVTSLASDKLASQTVVNVRDAFKLNERETPKVERL